FASGQRRANTSRCSAGDRCLAAVMISITSVDIADSPYKCFPPVRPWPEAAPDSNYVTLAEQLISVTLPGHPHSFCHVLQSWYETATYSAPSACGSKIERPSWRLRYNMALSRYFRKVPADRFKRYSIFNTILPNCSLSFI